MDAQPDSPFPVTRWTAILKVQRQDTLSAARALEDLCGTYWYPLYAFARRLGFAPYDAQDLTQGFFSYVFEKDLFANADRELGKLRTFLLTAFRRYASDVRDRERAQKRGGGQEILSLDVQLGEENYLAEPADPVTPERFFERNWAMSVLREAFRDLSQTENAAGRGEQFNVIAQFISPDEGPSDSYAAVSAQLGLSEENVRQTVSRLRRRFRDSLRRHIADTLNNPSEQQIDDELMALKEALREG